MLTCAIKDDGEPKVIQLTYENLWRELKDIPGAEIIVVENWFDAVEKAKNKYICFVEADCLVSSGYFASQLGLLQKDPYFRKVAVISAVTGVNNWANRFYGYFIDYGRAAKVTPNTQKRSSRVDCVQIAYIPGAIIRVNMLKKILEDTNLPGVKDLVLFSTELSLAFWRQSDGNRVHINPNATYVTTEDYVNDLGNFQVDASDLIEKFAREAI